MNIIFLSDIKTSHGLPLFNWVFPKDPITTTVNEEVRYLVNVITNGASVISFYFLCSLTRHCKLVLCVLSCI